MKLALGSQTEDAAGFSEPPVVGVEENIDLPGHRVSLGGGPAKEGLAHRTQIRYRDLELCLESFLLHLQSLYRSCTRAKRGPTRPPGYRIQDAGCKAAQPPLQRKDAKTQRRPPAHARLEAMRPHKPPASRTAEPEHNGE